MCLGISTSLDAQILDHFLGQILVKVEQPIDKVIASHQEFEGTRTSLKLKKSVSPVFHIYLLEFDHGNIHEERFLKELKSSPMVAVAQYNHILSHRVEPNDPEFDNQWQYINNGQSGGTLGADLDMDLAWDISTGGTTALGDTIVAAIIDDGFDWGHEDFGDNLWVNYSEIPNDGIDNDNNGYIDDYRGWNAYTESDNITGGSHGTPVTGIVGAKGNNGIGVAGVNWNVKLMIIQGGGQEADAIAAYSYCYTQRKMYNDTGGQEGAYVVTTNSSWGTDFGQAADAPLWCDFYNTLGEEGIVSCGATINGNQNVDVVGDLPTTCSSDYLIAVTNINRNDQKVSGAGYGPVSIDLGAFGAETWTTGFNNGYTSFGGTSGATPHVAGTVALMHSAPCPSFAAFAKSDPAASALLIKQYILEGVDPNASLAGVSVTEGRLNAYNSMAAMIDNCDPTGCFVPYSVVQENTTDTSSDISWSVGTETDQSSIRYRITGTTDWTELPNVVSPYTVTGLIPCSDYEYQIQAICDGTATDWTNSFPIETDGCCEPPAVISFANVSESTIDVSWNSVLIAEGYDVRYKVVSESVWTEINVLPNNASLSALEFCMDYELQIRTNCEGGADSDYSESYLFTTSGCGACIDNNYCASNSENASLEWLEAVVFNTINNVSGGNGGYANFTHLSTDVEAGQSYDITLTPGFAGTPYNEYFMVWIDYNQDGDFYDANEVAFDAGTTTDAAITGSITIPASSISGSTRMRVSQRWTDPAGPCNENYNYGEVEDYCLNIINDSPDSCDSPTNIVVSNIMETSVDLAWDDMNNASNYEVRYKEVAATDWASNIVSSSSTTLTGLTPCVEHEIQVRTICSTDMSDFSASNNFKSICTSIKDDIHQLSFAVQPNPVSDELTILFENSSGWSFTLMNVNGKVISSGQTNTNSYSISMNDYPAGVYFIQLESKGKKAVRKIVKF